MDPSRFDVVARLFAALRRPARFTASEDSTRPTARLGHRLPDVLATRCARLRALHAASRRRARTAVVEAD